VLDDRAVQPFLAAEVVGDRRDVLLRALRDVARGRSLSPNTCTAAWTSARRACAPRPRSAASTELTRED
jgi:hypothetical protein